MVETIGYSHIVQMLTCAVQQIRDNHKMLGELDSHGGDGDHGATMLRAMENLYKALKEDNSGEIKQLLYDAGWAVMGTDGGATGPLFGSFFMGMSMGLDDQKDLNAEELAKVFQSALAFVSKQTKAKVGDKTMMDALIPAVEEMVESSRSQSDIAVLVSDAAEAARKGVETTKDIAARFGRAKNIGNASIGFPDAGATSVSLIFEGFVKGVSVNA